MRLIFCYFSLFFISSGLAGCRPVALEITPTPLPATATTKPATLTATVTARPTHTLTPSSSPHPTLTATPSATPTETQTPLPSLEPQAAEEAIRQLLKEDVPCSFPCFWGIVPDRTTLEEVQNIYNHLNMTLKLTYQEGDKDYLVAGRGGFDDGFGVYILHIVRDDYVRSMLVGIELSKDPFPLDEGFAYSPRALMGKYGQPSRVEFFVDTPHEDGPAEFEDAAWYDMVLYFEREHFIIYYHYGLTKFGDFIRACPLGDRFSDVSLWLGKNPRYPPLRGIPLEKATNLTLEQFYDLLVKGSRISCFDLKWTAFTQSP